MDAWAKKIFTKRGFTAADVLGDTAALDVGCGQKKLPGAKGMDILSDSQADIVHDMNAHPWPIKDSSFDLVFMNHALEHCENVIDVLEEAYRVLKPGGRVLIQVPYFRSVDAFTDPTHTHFFTSRSLDYIIKDHGLTKYKYSGASFKKIGFWYAWPHPSKNPLVSAFKRFIHAFPLFYDQYLSILAPVKCLTWELEKI